MSTGSILVVDDVIKRYPGGVTALAGVSLRIDRGEAVAIVGPSGSGKSTLLHLIGALDRPSSGRVVLDGHDLVTLSDRRTAALRAHRIGFVFQQFHLPTGVPIRHAVADGLLYSGVPIDQRLRRAAEALDLVGLSARADHRPHQLSGGERQRAAVARAVVGEPALLLADEPTGNLDTAAGRGVIDLLGRLHDAGTTLIIITHDRNIAATLPRQVEMLDGRIAADSTVRSGAPTAPVDQWEASGV